MADAVIPGVVRAQVVLHGRSGKPEDRFVNTFGFRATDGVSEISETHYDAIAAALQELYTVDAPVGGYSLAELLSGTAISDTKPADVRMYDLGQPAGDPTAGIPPRVVHLRSFALPALSPSATLPNEIALVGSFYADRNLPRYRGRIYWGPLLGGTNVSLASTVQADVVPTGTAIDVLQSALKRLAQNATVDWCVISQKDAQARSVLAGWVDNRFDVQRRRGTAASARTAWSAF